MSVIDATGCPTKAASDRASAAPAVGALRAMLVELGELLGGMSDDHYVGSPSAGFTGSIGAHVRHCLDHVAALTDHALSHDSGACSSPLHGSAPDDGELDYDRRERGTAIEHERTAALREIERLQARLSGIETMSSERPIRVRGAFCAEGDCVSGPSSLGRELLFVISHTVHHNALLAAMCAALAVRTPVRFGYAPATLAHLDRTACAPSASSR
ncbi:MAG: hypothetical protein HRU75_06115 [Planctomycetia bacterium]|nr:MAG: hypothetical protein HRU75_06115 [Planctomycetia bacterium]